jgi:hypothetical protein
LNTPHPRNIKPWNSSLHSRPRESHIDIAHICHRCTTTMCRRLLQTYACDHSKVVCTTPCPFAQASAMPLVAPSSCKSEAAGPLSSSAEVSPMPGATSLPGRPVQQDVSPLLDESPQPAFRIKTDKPAAAAPFAAVPTSSHLDAALSDHAGEAQPEQPVQPRYCQSFFLHYLPQSRRPCRLCYSQPEWEDVRRRWVERYRSEHPMEKLEDLERLTELEM